MKMNKAQLRRFRFFRNRGFRIAEARWLARLAYSQMAQELSRRLRVLGQQEKVK